MILPCKILVVFMEVSTVEIKRPESFDLQSRHPFFTSLPMHTFKLGITCPAHIHSIYKRLTVSSQHQI